MSNKIESRQFSETTFYWFLEVGKLIIPCCNPKKCKVAEHYFYMHK